MKKTIVVLSILILCSCTAVRLGNGKTIVTAKKEKSFCNIKKIDPHCKIEGNYK